MAAKPQGRPARRVVKLYIGEWIARLERRPVDIAKAVDITEPYLSELISGKKKNPSIAVILAVADELGLSLNDLRVPPPARSSVEAAHRLDPGQLAALARLLAEMKQ